MKLKYILGIGLGLMITGGLMAGLGYVSGAQTSLTWEGGPRIIEMSRETQKIFLPKTSKNRCPSRSPKYHDPTRREL